jgi:exodeoxyribonuclease VII small subunit
MNQQAVIADIDRLSFEDAVRELEGIVRKLEAGGMELDASIAYYTRGTALRSHCEKKLQEAKLKVEKIITAPNGSLSTEPMEAE